MKKRNRLIAILSLVTLLCTSFAAYAVTESQDVCAIFADTLWIMYAVKITHMWIREPIHMDYSGRIHAL